ncbi:M12 family metallopeptidase [Kitasatospora sp. NPDC085879]|uniref:M12 family metallopeptidase n=1 Tax=Kitasatospora sp. NPDC085879 TaxID=3154769 RepID=UPI003438AC35
MVETAAPAPVVQKYCTVQPRVVPELRPGLGLARERAILNVGSKWVNGTHIHYAFLDGTGGGRGKAQLDQVRDAFRAWKDLGIGLEFEEVESPAMAEVRIAFEDDGSWSYVGRDALTIGGGQATMNFGWDVTSTWGRATSLHETGHSLGLEHEHQNPNAGIRWNEEAVYASLAAPPNNWTREETFHNILRKLSKDEVTGSVWDALSIMEYPFEPGLILEPEKYGREGLQGGLTLSATDKEMVRAWYPPLTVGPTALQPGASAPLDLSSGGQADFGLQPGETRAYDIGSFGKSDVVMVVFEDVGGELRYLAGEDDSGTEANARLNVRLVGGRRYVLRVRLYSVYGGGPTAVMYW